VKERDELGVPRVQVGGTSPEQLVGLNVAIDSSQFANNVLRCDHAKVHM